MIGSPQISPAVELTVNRTGDLVVLVAGEKPTVTRNHNKSTHDAHTHDAPRGGAPAFLRMLHLAASDGALTPELAFGRELARSALRAAAAMPAGQEQHAELTPAEFESLRAARPTSFHRLADYSLCSSWQELVLATATEVQALDAGRDEYFRRHGIGVESGQLWFHLAEQPGDASHPFAFIATLARSGADGRVQHQPLATAMHDCAGDVARQERLLAPLRRAAEQNEALRALLDSHEVFHSVAWTPQEAHGLLRAAPTLEAFGIRVRLPRWWHGEPLRPQLRVQVGGDEPAALGLGALLDFQLRYFIGENELSADEWKQLMRGAAGLHHLRGSWVELDANHQMEALRHWESVAAAAARGEVGFAEGMRLLAGLQHGTLREGDTAAWTVAQPGPWLAQTLAALQGPSGSTDADPGPALRGELRPYQRDGVSWLWLLVRLGLGGCLADDMGLGKTIQVIALLLLLQQHDAPGPHLIVLPASLLGNWRAELTRFGPDLRFHVAHRSAGDVDQPPAFDELDVVLTTYGTLLRQEWLRDRAWGLIVLDEAQAIKNAEAKQTRAVKALSGQHRLILTGTPVENTLVDLWSLFDFSSPGLLGSAADFKAFSRRLGTDKDSMEPLRALVRPYILRRLKTDRRVISDLPDKTELQVYCGLSRVQATLYARAVDSLASEVEATDGIRRRGLILAYLTRFKQICNHPSHYSGDDRYAVEDSAKFLRLQELCGPIVEAGEKLLVFTQFREVTGPLCALLAECFGRPGLVLHGGTPVARRAELVAQFQSESGPPFMVLSLKAGGTGLNLTAASHVVHFDRWWNPAVENQATDRAYRIGQHKNVLVHKFVCRGTLEERIDAMIQSKQGLADGVLADDGERRLTELSTEELMRVVSLDLRAALSED